MPLSKRNVVSAAALHTPTMPQGVPSNNALDALLQQQMTGVLDQLAYLCVYSAEMYNDLLVQCNSSAERMVALGQRVDNIAGAIPAVEEYIGATHPGYFLQTPGVPHKIKTNNQLCHFMPQSRPASLNDIFTRECLPLPALEPLDQFRDDGLSSAAMYSNPNFFIETWLEEQRRQQEEARKARAERRAAGGGRSKTTSSRAAGPREVRRVEKKVYDASGLSANKVTATKGAPAAKQAAPARPTTQPVNANATQYQASHDSGAGGAIPAGSATRGAAPAHPQRAATEQVTPAAPPPQPPQQQQEHAPMQQQPSFMSAAPSPAASLPPPPPPAGVPQPAPKHIPSTYAAPPPVAAPPAPSAPAFAPPPPPPGGGGPPPPPSSAISVPKAPPPPKGAPPPPSAPAEPASGGPVNVRSNLLNQIQQGKNLKKAEEREVAATPVEPAGGGGGGFSGFDVEKIMARRAAIADSDDDDDFDDDWD